MPFTSLKVILTMSPFLTVIFDGEKEKLFPVMVNSLVAPVVISVDTFTLGDEFSLPDTGASSLVFSVFISVFSAVGASDFLFNTKNKPATTKIKTTTVTKVFAILPQFY